MSVVLLCNSYNKIFANMTYSSYFVSSPLRALIGSLLNFAHTCYRRIEDVHVEVYQMLKKYL